MHRCRQILILLVAVLLLGLLGGCATPKAQPPEVQQLLADARFTAFAEPSVQELFAVSPGMRHFLSQDLRKAVRDHGVALGLFRALTERGHLRIDYDASYTRTAAQAFEARAGNCLSLVLLTAALAQELGLSVHYQWVEVPEIWTRSEQFTLLNGHVNLSLSQAPRSLTAREMGHLTIDFVGIEEPRLSRVRPLDQDTLVAMFFNNRGVELMEAGAMGEAHASLRAAVRADAQYMNIYNTLAVLYRRLGDLDRAEELLQQLRKTEPSNHHVAANLAMVWREQGRVAEAERLEASQPAPPFADYDRGMALAGQARWTEALTAFERQQRLAPDFHGLHFQLARVHFQLGNLRQAQRHLEEAVEESTTSALRQRYQAKLRALQRAS
jgi:tetratricopeptide (TPR) repeat protein